MVEEEMAQTVVDPGFSIKESPIQMDFFPKINENEEILLEGDDPVISSRVLQCSGSLNKSIPCLDA